MNARERIVDQLEMSQMAKNGVYLFTMDKGLEDDLNNRIISDAVRNAFKTNGVLLSKKTSITKENEDKMVIGDKEKKNIFFVRTRKEDNELNVYNNEYNIRKIEFPEKVIIRTENVRGEVESTKQPKVRERVRVPLKPEEGIGKNGRKFAKRPEELRIKSDIIEALDLSKENTSITKKLNAIYYLEMFVGVTILVSTIILYQALGLMAIPMFILGLGLVFTWLASKWKINKIRKEHVI